MQLIKDFELTTYLWKTYTQGTDLKQYGQE